MALVLEDDFFHHKDDARTSLRRDTVPDQRDASAANTMSARPAAPIVGAHLLERGATMSISSRAWAIAGASSGQAPYEELLPSISRLCESVVPPH